MERYSTQSVGDVLRNLLEESSLQNRMDELKGADAWAGVVGEHIAGITGRPSVKNGVMTVKVANASLRNELHMSRSRLCEIINQIIGKETIKEIKFTT